MGLKEILLQCFVSLCGLCELNEPNQANFTIHHLYLVLMACNEPSKIRILSLNCYKKWIVRTSNIYLIDAWVKILNVSLRKSDKKKVWQSFEWFEAYMTELSRNRELNQGSVWVLYSRNMNVCPSSLDSKQNSGDEVCGGFQNVRDNSISHNLKIQQIAASGKVHIPTVSVFWSTYLTKSPANREKEIFSSSNEWALSVFVCRIVRALLLWLDEDSRAGVCCDNLCAATRDLTTPGYFTLERIADKKAERRLTINETTLNRLCTLSLFLSFLIPGLVPQSYLP